MDGIKAGTTKTTTTAKAGTANNLSEDLITPRISSIAGGDVVFANQDVHRDTCGKVIHVDEEDESEDEVT